MMNFNDKLLSDIVAFRTYARYVPDIKRRESLDETCERYLVMHEERFPSIRDDIRRHGQQLLDLRAMPSMRALQFAGPAIKQNNARMFNCSFKAVNDVDSFGEILYLLLSGCGVGFSVQWANVRQLPVVKRPKEEGVFFIQDSIQGWAQALDILVRSYFYGHPKPIFEYGMVREKGALLKTTGARAPGPEPLRKMLVNVENLLRARIGRRLRPIDVHDLVCLISECVRAGGIRRAALISLFDPDDDEMLAAKSGNWFEDHPYRAGANNSAVICRDDEHAWEHFSRVFKALRESNSGEPGIYWTNDPTWGTNPCVEISLQDSQFCNLTTVNQSRASTKHELQEAVMAASFFGTLQAAYTDFDYLRPEWKKTTDLGALLGVSFTGIADAAARHDPYLREMAQVAVATNYKTAEAIDIQYADRVTALKPEGSSSAVLGSSSGIHARHAPYYLRRIRLGSDDSALVEYLKAKVPDLMEVDKYGPDSVIITIPQKSPVGAIVRDNETAASLFDRALTYNRDWVAPGHNRGENRNNVSCTLSVREEEWDEVESLLWFNRFSYNGMSILPYDGGSYEQAPFETCDEETYLKYSERVKDLDLREIVEEEDATNMTAIVACAGGACEI